MTAGDDASCPYAMTTEAANKKLLVHLDKRQLTKAFTSLLSSMGYEDVAGFSHGKNLAFEAVKKDAFQRAPVAVYVLFGKRPTGSKKVADIAAEPRFQGKSLVVASLAGFTDKACEKAPETITLLDPSALLDLFSVHGVDFGTADRHALVEKCFLSREGLAHAKDAFRRKAGKKYLGVVGSAEEVKDVIQGYAPVGVFPVSRRDSVQVRRLISKTKKDVARNNTFYVNLATLELYYTESVGLKRERRVAASHILSHIQQLDEEARDILADIVRHDEVSLEELAKRHHLFREDDLEKLMPLVSDGLIDRRPGVEPGYISNLDLPAFDSPSFRLEDQLVVGSSVEVAVAPDAAHHSHRDVERLLARFWSATVSFEGVVYLPYFTATFMDDEGRTRSETRHFLRFRSRD